MKNDWWLNLKAEFKYLFFGTKRRWIKILGIIFIPFLYGFTYLSAFWDPLAKTEDIPFALVNNDCWNAQLKDTNDSIKTTLVEDIINPGQKSIISLSTPDDKYHLKIDYFNSETAKTEFPDKADNYYFTLTFPKDFTKTINDKILNPDTVDLSDLVITGQGSYKRNFILGEGSEFAKEIKQLIYAYILPEAIAFAAINHYYLEPKPDEFENLIPKWKQAWPSLIPIFDYIENNIVKVKALIPIGKAKEMTREIFKLSQYYLDSKLPQVSFNLEGEDKDNYGYGLAPYFISIALWVGILMCMFLIERKPIYKSGKLGWLKSYLNKALLFIGLGLIQGTILVSMLIPIGLYLGPSQIALYGFAYLCSVIFALIIQGIVFCFKDADFGKFIVIVLLVLQLTSTNGTFPTIMQPPFFGAISHILPFTYTIDTFREIFTNPSSAVIGKDIGILLAFAVFFFLLGLLRNYYISRFDYQLTNKVKRSLKDWKERRKQKK